MKSAVLVIDLQQGLFEDEGKPYDYENSIERINSITRHARHNSIPVIFIYHEQTEGPLQHGCPAWHLVPELKTKLQDFVVRKTTPDSFLKTNLLTLLNQEEVTNLIVCGYATEFCVDSTVRRAAALGFSIQLVADAHTTHDKNHATAESIRTHHNETLSNIKSFGVSITAVETNKLFI